MAGMFAIFLMLLTLITGLLWCLEKFRWAPARQRRVEVVRKRTNGEIDGNILAEVAKPKNWVDTLASLFPVLFLVFVVRSFLYEPFQIPSGSMIPTLLVGDFILVEKFSYGIKNPITNTTLIPTGTPQRGDVAVFKFPRDPKVDFIKRIIGLPGDKIIYNSETKELLIYPSCKKNEKKCDRGFVSTPLNLHYTAWERSNCIQVISQMQSYFYTKEQYQAEKRRGFNAKTVVSELNRRAETLGNNAHHIFSLPMVLDTSKYFYKQGDQPIGHWIVPKDHYFVMGDNRDNSEDSRFWGFVPKHNLVGRAVFIWMSFSKQPDEWITGVRLNRIGKIH